MTPEARTRLVDLVTTLADGAPIDGGRLGQIILLGGHLCRETAPGSDQFRPMFSADGHPDTFKFLCDLAQETS